MEAEGPKGLAYAKTRVTLGGDSDLPGCHKFCSYWPLGSRIEPLTFCGLNNKSKGIFKMPMFLDPA